MIFLQLRNELWKLFGKKRTYIGSTMFLLTQVIFILFLEFGKGPYRQLVEEIERTGNSAEHYMSNLTVATFALIPIAFLMLPLYTSLIGGDLVAKEAEDGTLRMILSRPMSRLRLLLLKWMAGTIFSLVLVVTFGLFGALFARMFFPSPGGMFVVMPGVVSVFEGAAAWQRFAVAHLVMTVEAWSIMTLALMFSCFDIKPASATILAISFFFINMILHDQPFFRDYQEWFFIHHLLLWTNVLHTHIPWWRVGESFSILAGYNLTFMIIGCTVFQMRDIKS
jgi:ABC-2 type transport system permease protein